LAVAAVFALGIGSAAMLARGGKEVSARPMPLPAVPAPKVSEPPPTIPEPTRPVAESPQISPSERVRRPGKGHAVRPQAVAEEVPPPTKKSKADDKIAPSPYTAPKAP
jgi:hypothetical protein